MSSATLQDQMGAKALIDQMRHRTMQVQEHLDLAQRRDEVKTRLQEHYRRQGIEVDDALIEQGVREFFKDRLAFEAPDVSRAQALLARLYITRDQWLRRWGWRAGAVLGVLLGLGLTVYFASQGADAVETRWAAIDVQRLQADLQDMDVQMEEVGARLATLQAAIAVLPSVGPHHAEGVRALAAAREQRDSIILPRAVTVDNHEEAQAAARSGAVLAARLPEQINASTGPLQTGERLVSIKARLDQLVQSAEYAAARTDLPDLGRKESSARAALTTGDAAKAEEHVIGLAELLKSSAALKGVEEQLRALQAGFAALKLTSTEQRQVAAMAAAVTSAAARRDAAAAAKALDDMASMLDFARTPIALDIHRGKPSIVERTFQKQGKSYFAIVVATDPAGNSVPLRITSAETGRTEMASRFGVRVPLDVFERIKADKLADGHVDDAGFAAKPAGSLTFQYRAPIAATPDFILEW